MTEFPNSSKTKWRPHSPPQDFPQASARQVPFLGPQIHTSGYSGQYLGCWSWEVFSTFSLKKMRRKLQETVLFDVCLLKKNTDFGSILARTPRCIPSHHHPSTTARKRHSAHELAARLRSAGRLQLHQSKAYLVEKGRIRGCDMEKHPQDHFYGINTIAKFGRFIIGLPTWFFDRTELWVCWDSKCVCSMK